MRLNTVSMMMPGMMCMMRTMLVSRASVKAVVGPRR